ncbi:uncharacterized protein LOC107849262 [Capsicum annuum]|uniref:uncharacterized protein LOC107849262 n=1 Tax=Capsicum annuum TaxID=4072 RepID=UPI0007BFA72E|nr:uncharacterized protein LOC107849262 [Capsicum annuum]
MAIVTRSGQTFGKDVVDLGEDPNEKANEEQANAKRKWLEEPIDNDPKPNETSVERPTVVEENVESEKTPKVIEDDIPIILLPQIKIPPTFPQRLKKKDDDTKFKKFLIKFSNLSVNIPLLKALQEMPGYAKFIKDLVTKKQVMDCLGAPKPIIMRLLIIDGSIKKPVGVLYDVLVKVNRFIFLADFVILDCEIGHEVPIILGRPLLATKRALVDVECGEIKFGVNNEEVSFNVCKSMKQSMNLQVILVIDVVDDEVVNTIEMDLVNDPLVGYCGTLGVRWLKDLMKW